MLNVLHNYYMNKINKTPKTWNELLDAGYVVELTEEQIAIAKDKLNGDKRRAFSYANNDHLTAGIEAEEKMRARKGGQ